MTKIDEANDNLIGHFHELGPLMFHMYIEFEEDDDYMFDVCITDTTTNRVYNFMAPLMSKDDYDSYKLVCVEENTGVSDNEKNILNVSEILALEVIKLVNTRIEIDIGETASPPSSYKVSLEDYLQNQSWCVVHGK